MKTYYKGYYMDGNGAIYDSKDEVINFVKNLHEAKDFIDSL